MHDLTAQVTSSLLPFPGVTIDALGEDEITLDSVLQGKFTVGRSGLAWLTCGPHLEVVHSVTGERLSAYCFSGGGEHPPTVLAARDFSWLKRSGLLVGLEEAEGNVLCLYDLGLSRVVKAVVIPGRITAIEPLVSYGGASTSTQHLHQSLRWFFGIAAVVTDLGHVLLVDLCLDDLSGSQSELEASALQVVTKSPADIPRLREVGTGQGRHLCLQLNGPSGVGATALQYISRTNQLAVGFANGYLQLWNMKTLKKEYHSQLEGGGVAVYAFTFQEPENDPRNCCYLWAVQSSQDIEGDTVSLRLLQLAFSERKCLSSGKILYEGLEYCEERYSQELGGTGFPLRAQTTNTRLLSCQTIEKFRSHPDRDDSMNEAASPDTSVSLFSWQVKAYGQGTPSTFIGVFDINRWYHAQMPDSLRMGESLQNCPYLAVWSLDPVVHMVSSHVLLDVVVHDRTLTKGLPFTCPPPEQYFNPTTYNFDATCLLNSGIVHLTCSGYQKETLSFLKKAAPCSSDIISASYSRCLMSGLLSPRLSDTQVSSLSQEEQLDAILSTAVETSSLGLITGCIKQWTAEEQPGSALNLRYILDWAWNKVVQTKEELDTICAPLFDSSSNFTDPQTLQLLQHSQRLLGNLSTIFHCLLSEAQELTQKGLVGLINKNMVSTLISKYAQVVLWFCRTGLLPEGSDDDALQISRPFYTQSVISNYYTIRREELTKLAKGKWCADCLMIDGLVGQCGERLTNLWKRDEGGTGQYPPPTLHALLDIYLLDNIDETTKHAVVIYLLLDVMHSFPNKEGASIHSFPSAFAIPVGLVKLVQGLWLLDHHGHQTSFELLLHPAASSCHFKWQHERVLNALMCQDQHSIALRYLQVTKPPISSTSQAKLCLSVLLHNRCLIEAWSLVRQHSNQLNMGELLGVLYESCQELGLVKELLKLPLGLPEQECLEKFLQGTGGLQNRELLMVHYLQQANYIPALHLNHRLKINMVNERDPKLKERANTRNAILEQYGKVLPRVQRKLATERVKPYQPPYTIHREVSRPQPLSTISKRSANEKVISRAGFINSVLTKIEEVCVGKDTTPQSSPMKSTSVADIQSPSHRPPSSVLPDPFLGTPITMTSKRKSRLMDLVVQPSCQSPQHLLTPPRLLTSWVSPKSISKAPELTLLQTPQVVKRARALAASGPVFSAFTPQSILRSSLRPTPVATPSASPGRSITPPLRSKESRITFIEEVESPELVKDIQWTNGIAAEGEISLLTSGSALSKAAGNTWSSQPSEEDVDKGKEQHHVKFLPPEGDVASPLLRSFEREASSIPEETKTEHATQTRLSLSLDTTQTSVRSTDTTLEYYDAPLSQDQEIEEQQAEMEQDEDVVMLNIKVLSRNEEPEEKPLPTLEQTPILTSEEDEVVKEDAAFEDFMERDHEQEAENEEDVPSSKEEEQDDESSSKQHYAANFDHEDTSSQVCNQVTESIESTTVVESQDESAIATEQDFQSHVTEITEHLVLFEATEQTSEPEEDLEQSADLTEFVQQHLFGNDLSPTLTRSGIHSASRTQVSFNRESLSEVEEEQEVVEPPPVLTSQKSNASVASSEPTGTDSHSVVSVNDSEEISSPESDEEEDEDDDDEEEEEEQSEEDEGEKEVEEGEDEDEDSGSEVEIIEEVQGNRSLPPITPSSVFFEQEHAHFLPSHSEQEAAEFSLITPTVEMKMVEENMEDEVMMVRVDTNEGGMEDKEQGSSYMELKPSTTLLVPLELVEGQHDPLHLPEIQENVVPDDQGTETHCGFSLMLDMDEDEKKEADKLPVENDMQSSNFSTQPSEEEPNVEPNEDLVAKPEVIILGPDEQDAPVGEVTQDNQKKDMDSLDGSEEHELEELEPEKDQTDHQAVNTEITEEIEEANVLKDTELDIQAEDHNFAPALEEEPPADVVDDSSVAQNDAAKSEEMQVEKEMSTPAVDQEEPEMNGPSETDTQDTQTVLSAQTDTVVEEQQQQDHRASTEMDEGTIEEMTEVIETKRITRGRQRKEDPAVNNELDEQPVVKTATAQRKKASSTPTRRTTRGRKAVSLISPLQEEAEEQERDETVEPEMKATASTRRTPRKSQVQASTPRRSTRKSQLDRPRDQEEEEAADELPAITSKSKASSPARRRVSQRAATTRTSQSDSEELSAAPDGDVKEEEMVHQEEVVPQIKIGQQKTSKTPTPAKRKSAQADTPRRSTRRVLGSSMVEVTPLKSLEEENELEAVSAPPVKHSSRKKKSEQLEEDEDKKRQRPSPGRTTRQSGRISLDVYPQVKLVPISLPQSAIKMRQMTAEENAEESDDLHKPEQNSNTSHTSSRRPIRSKLWNHPEEDLPLLNFPLEVDSETPVADALIKRLQQEGGVVVSKMVRTNKRSTQASLEQTNTLPPVTDNQLPEAPEEELSPGEHSIIYAPPRRRTRAQRAESPGPSEETAAPATRRRRQVKDGTLQVAAASEEDNADVLVRKKRTQTAKSKSVLEPPPEVEIDLVSPLPSPVNPDPRRAKGEEAPTSSMNLRRKRIMNMVFTKPVTRRKKL